MRKLLVLLPLAFLMLLTTSCNNSKKKVIELVPLNATYVVKINTEEIYKKVGKDKNQLSELSNRLFSGMLSDNNQLNKEILLNWNESGLDLKENIVLFGMQDNNLNVLGIQVSDDKLLKEYLTTSGLVEEQSIQKIKGVNYFTLGYDAIFAWDKYKLLVIKSNEELDAASEVKQIFNPQKDNQIYKTKSFQDFLSQNADISIYRTTYFIEEALKSSTGLSVNLSSALNGIVPLTYITFDNGEINAQTKLQFTDATKEDEVKNIVQNIFGNSSAKHLAYFDNTPSVFLTTNLKGDKLKELMGREGLSKSFDQMPFINMNDILSNLDGDFTIAFEQGEELPTAILVDMKNPSAIQSLLTQMSTVYQIIQKVGENVYKLPVKDRYIGTHNNLLYISKDAEFAKKSHTGAFLDKTIPNQITKNKIYIHGFPNIISTVAEKNMEGNQNMKSLHITDPLDILSLCESYTVTISNDMNIDMKVQFTNKNKNSLAILFDYLAQSNPNSTSQPNE